MGNIKEAAAVNINAIQTAYEAAPTIELFYTQANVTNKAMEIITVTTVEVKKHALTSILELPHGLRVSNKGGSMLVPYTNIRNIVYKA